MPFGNYNVILHSVMNECEVLKRLTRMTVVLGALYLGGCASMTGVLSGDESGQAATSSSADRNLARAYELIEADDLAGAEELLLTARANDPANLWALLNLGVVYQRTGRAQDAEAAYREVLDSELASVQAGNAPTYAYWRSPIAALARSNLKKLTAPATTSERVPVAPGSGAASLDPSRKP